MKNRAFMLLAMLPMVLTGCFPTRIVTVSPGSYTGSYAGTTSGYVSNYPYSTTVSVAKTHTVTTTTQVSATNDDICLHLDLQAVAAAFAQSSTIRDFEILLNDSSYMISNLDLDGDGYVDYLRVVETLQGNVHVFVIQDVLGNDTYQDVASIVVENPLADYHIEVIGAPFIYGPNYIVSPVFIARPCILSHFGRRDYSPWSSPWHWGYYPSRYKHPAPVYLNHYQAYVGTFMGNHHYCHEVKYPASCHYDKYNDISRGKQRNDYGKAHPEKTFTTRTANIAGANSAVSRSANGNKARNAGDIRSMQEKSKVTTTSSTSRTSGNTATRSNSTSSRSTSTTSGSTSKSSGNTGSSASRSGGSSRSTRSGSTHSSATSSRSSSSSSSSSSRSSSGSSTTVRSSVRSSGSVSTVKRSSSSSGSSSRSSSSSSSRSRSSR